MTLPEITPAWDAYVASVAAALAHDKGRVYLDANVLIHCYEMNVAASEDLLQAFEAYEPRVSVPAWAAKETWDHTANRIAKRPLRPLAERVRNALGRFQKESTRYIDDGALRDGSPKDDFLHELAEAFEGVFDLIKKVQDYEPKADLTTARLLPFIDRRLLASDLGLILDEVSRTAQARMAHQIPPGFGDVGGGAAAAEASAAGDDAGDEGRSVGRRGKVKNPHGDLIIWLEILQDCARQGAEQLVFITNDTNKGDLVYVPKQFRNDKGRPQPNGGLITLPLPLLVQEARQRCPSITHVHIVTVEMLAHVLKSLNVEVGNLVAALQAEADEETTSEANDGPGASAPPDDANYQAEFGSADMSVDLDDQDPVDVQIRELNSEGWKTQNQAARKLLPLLSTATRAQRIQIGRGLVEAAKDGALASVEFLTRALDDAALGVATRSDLLVGVLAQIYIDDTGVPKKPVSPLDLTEVVYQHQGKAEFRGAFEAVMSRCQSQARKYLALPGETLSPIPFTLSLENDSLRGVEVAEASLLEEAAVSMRAIQPTGAALALTTEALAERLATEFVVPKSLLVPDQPPGATFELPPLTGFIVWGPNTGTLLR